MSKAADTLHSPAYEESEQEAELQLGKRSLPGSLGQIALLLVLVPSTVHRVDHPALTGVTGGLILAFNLLRLFLSMRQAAFYPSHRSAWNKLFTLSIVVPGAAWGLLFYMTLRYYGPSGYATMICMLVGSGIAAAITTSVSPKRSLARAFISLVIGAPLIELVSRPDHETIPLALIFLTYYVFLWFQSAIQGADYWNGLLNRARLLQETNRLKEFLDTIPGLVSWIGTDLKFRGANRRYIENYGLSGYEYLGHHITAGNPDVDFLKAIEGFAESEAKQEAVETPISILGEKRWHLVVMRKVASISSKEELPEIYLICIDVHDLRLARETLDHQRMGAERVSRLASLGEMAASIAHEIRNPLTTILLSAQLIQKESRDLSVDASRIQFHTDQIISTSERINTIIDGLTGFSRSTESAPFSTSTLRQIVSDSVGLASFQFGAKGISIQLEPLPEYVKIRCRPVEISQVVVNLLSNAIEACKGQSEGWVKIRTEVAKGWVDLRVTDSGPGVPSSIRRRLFEPFFTTKAPGVGTGLGLSISRKIVSAHGGRLYLDENARNTTFVVRLPLAGASEREAAA